MKLLARFQHHTIRLWMRELTVWACVALVLTAFELVGRRLTSDIEDAVCFSFLLPGIWGLWRVHRAQPLQVLRRVLPILRRFRRWLNGPALQFGIDLRGKPALQRSIPLRWKRRILALALFTVALLAAAEHFPINARNLLVSYFYLGYLLLLVSLWVTMLVAALISGLFAWGVLHDAFVESFSGTRKRPLRGEVLAVVGCVVALVAAAWLLPAWVPLLVYAVTICLLSSVFFTAEAGFLFVWKNAMGDIQGLDGRIWIWLNWLIPLLAMIDLVILSSGTRLNGDAEFPFMPITFLFGSCLAWTTVAASLAAIYHGLRLVLIGILMNPRFSQRPTLFIEMPAPHLARQLLEPLLRGHGWKTCWGQRKPRNTEVAILLDENAPDHAGQEQWPLVLTAAALDEPDVQERLHRRDEIQNRRHLMNGFRRLFKRAARRRNRPGTGYWIGLQHWYLVGMTRDVDADVTSDRDATMFDRIIGQPFHRTFPIRARQHYCRITDALEIDLIFVEDGVNLKRFGRVLSMMFEIYDVYGGRQRAEDKHFVGMPGIRVILHDFSFDQDASTKLHGYPEPDYEEIGRARILHVFRDRGESEVEVSDPQSSEDAPVLVGV